MLNVRGAIMVEVVVTGGLFVYGGQADSMH